MKNQIDIEKWLMLGHISGIGAIGFHKLYKYFETPTDILSAKPNDLKNARLSEKIIASLRNIPAEKIKADLAWLKDDKHHILCFDDSKYPQSLRRLPDAPPLLFVKGDITLLDDPQIAIVGSRNPTPSGKKIAYDFARSLAEIGLLVNSGMARGIDSAAHNGALDSGSPSLAVIATGQDIIYPAENKPLAQKLADNGVIVSEFPCGTPPHSSNFPRRNRIISGLAIGVLVVEAKFKSGALITARYANEQGKEVFAIPGSIHNPVSKGCHRLIKEGAMLVETTNDILLQLKSHINLNERDTSSTDQAKSPTENLDRNNTLEDEHSALLEQMGYDPVTADQLAERTGKPIAEIASILLILELENHISNQGGFYCRIQ